ncbi:MAG: NAD(P)/FAD-dependent oxidoreductase [Clostridiaceae bacterium]
MRKHKVLIAGAGASGVLTAIQLKQNGIDCALIDSQDRILKKLLTTGNGRCNLTNEKLKDCKDFSQYYSTSDESFKWEPLYNFGAEKALSVFEDLGLPVITLEEGKIYPMSLQASSVSDLLRLRLAELNVPIYTNSRIKDIKPSKDGKIFNIMTSDDTYLSEILVIATGGLALPLTGSDGSMLKLVKGLGHTIIKPLPALVQLKTDFKQSKALSGVKSVSELTLISEGFEIYKETGELLFTDYGVSGPPILQISRFSTELNDKGKEAILRINLFPELNVSEVTTLIEKQTRNFPLRSASDLLNGILNKKLIPVLFKLAGLEKMNTPVSQIPTGIIEKLITLLTFWEMNITDTNGFANSQSTIGGVSLKEVDPISLESKIIPGCYFTGEILDVCGACGGYNLQWAWSSAMAVADKIIKNSN